MRSKLTNAMSGIEWNGRPVGPGGMLWASPSRAFGPGWGNDGPFGPVGGPLGAGNYVPHTPGRAGGPPGCGPDRNATGCGPERTNARWSASRQPLIGPTGRPFPQLISRLCKDPELMPEPDAIAKSLSEPLLKIFPPALLGRLVTIPCSPLSDEMQDQIVELQINTSRSGSKPAPGSRSSTPTTRSRWLSVAVPKANQGHA